MSFRNFVAPCLLAGMVAVALGQVTLVPDNVVAAGSSVILASKDKTVAEFAFTGGTAVSWSPNGKYVAVWAGKGSGKVAVFKVPRQVELGGKTKFEWAPLMITKAKAAAGAVWSPDSSELVAEKPGGGFFKVAISGDGAVESEVLPVGDKPSYWDGNRLLFVGKNELAGLWRCNKDGSSARRLLKGHILSGAVSAGAHAYYFVSANDKGEMTLNRNWLNGGLTTPITKVDQPDFFPSPGSPFVLVHRDGGYTLVSLTDSWSAKIPLDLRAAPQWVGPARLLAATGSHLMEIGVNREGSVDVKEVPCAHSSTEPNAEVAVARRVGLFLSAQVYEASPFDKLQRPISGQMRLEGTIDSVDPEGDAVSVLVDKAVFENGSELNLPTPVRKSLKMPGGVFGTGTRKIQITDLTPDREASLTIQSKDFSGTENAVVTGAYLPWLAPVAGAAATHVANRVDHPALVTEYDGITRVPVVVPMTYPILGDHKGSGGFLDPRDGGSRRHHGNDLMAKKMHPLIATFDGTIYLRQASHGNSGNDATLVGDNGITAIYRHMNNDTPGTDDDLNDPHYTWAAGLSSGDHVVEGQFIGYVGNSGNAKKTPPHCHFELIDQESGAILNPYPSLKAARHIYEPVYADAFTDLKPTTTDEVRVDGVIVKLDYANKTVWVDSTAKSTEQESSLVKGSRSARSLASRGGRSTRNYGSAAPVLMHVVLFPEYVPIRLGQGDLLLGSQQPQPIDFGSLRAGMLLCSVAKRNGADLVSKQAIAILSGAKTHAARTKSSAHRSGM